MTTPSPTINSHHPGCVACANAGAEDVAGTGADHGTDHGDAHGDADLSGGRCDARRDTGLGGRASQEMAVFVIGALPSCRSRSRRRTYEMISSAMEVCIASPTSNSGADRDQAETGACKQRKAGPVLSHEPSCERCHDDRYQRDWQRAETGVEGRVVAHVLEVEGVQEEEAPERAERADRSDACGVLRTGRCGRTARRATAHAGAARSGSGTRNTPRRV